ncbi:MAG TPA: hypothetical protein VKU19_00610 [Bryobacteraceae bacterium]|nr:hypothetical protein [Bryobacteraceae bacterium]
MCTFKCKLLSIVSILLVLPATSTIAVAADGVAKPLTVFRYRNLTTQMHAFTTEPESRHPLSAAFLQEAISGQMASSPLFYLYTEPYTSTIAIHRFQAVDGSMTFAANEQERQEFLQRGLQELDDPVFVYNRKVEGATEVYRVDNPSNQDIIYTTSLEEKNYYLKRGWSQKASLGYTQAASSTGTGILLDATVKLETDDLSRISSVENWGRRMVFSGANDKVAGLAVGQILYAEHSNVLPLGLVAKVTSVTRNAFGETEVQTEPAQLSDAFSEVHLYVANHPLAFYLPDDAGSRQLAVEASKLRERLSESGAQPGSGAVKPEFLMESATAPIKTLPHGFVWGLVKKDYSANLYTSNFKNATYTVDVSGNLTIEASTELVYNSDNVCTVNPTAIFILSPYISGSLGIKASLDVSTSKDNIAILPPFTATLPLSGPPVSMDLNLYAGFNASAGVSATLTATADLRMSGEATYDRPTNSVTVTPCPKVCPAGFACGDPPATGATCTFTPTLTASFDANAQATVYLKPQVDLYIGAYGTGFGPNAYAKFQLQAKIEPPNLNVHAQLIPGVGAKIQICYQTLAQVAKDLDPWIDTVFHFPLIVAPTITSFAINSGAASTTNRNVTLNLAAVGLPTQYMASESSAFAGAVWQPYTAAASFMLSAGGGVKTVYLKMQNSGGVSAVKSASITLVVAPTISSFSINNGAGTTINRLVTLNNVTSGSPTQYMASESSTFSGASWQAYSAAPAFTLSAGGSVKTVYFKIQNSAGMSSPSSAIITLIVAPTVTSFKINNGAASTTSTTVTLNNAASGSPTQYMASESSTFSGASWKTYTAAPTFTLSSAKGTKTVYFKVQNLAGAGATATATITLK